MQCVCYWPLKKLYEFPFQFPIAIKEHVCLFVQKTSATLPNSRLCMIDQMQDIITNAQFKAHLDSLSSAQTIVHRRPSMYPARCLAANARRHIPYAWLRENALSDKLLSIAAPLALW